MDAPDISVYGEAKGEYTRQLCVFVVPTLETYILGLLEEAKNEAPNPKKVLWQFQTILQGIPDWNQDKVVRETEKIQKDCNCDYLDELITAVFIAHTKVLSAIRLSTRQKKLQITIPKMDHFIHRLLCEAARNLWASAYLFADCNSIEKQKNFRQVSILLHESVLQAIRGLLPVKSILREYLHDDEEEETKGGVEETSTNLTQEPTTSLEDTSESIVKDTPVEPTAEPVSKPVSEPVSEPVSKPVSEPVSEPVSKPVSEPVSESVSEPVSKSVSTPVSKPDETVAQLNTNSMSPPIIQIDTKPSVTFSNDHVFFDSDSLEANEIQEIPFLDEDDEELTVNDEVLPIETDSM